MTDNASESVQSHRRGQGSAPPGGSCGEGVGGEVHEPPALCCPVLQTIFRDPVFVPESGNTYDRQALEMFWLASRRAGAQPRDPLNNTVLSTTQVFINWDKRREVNAWLQENPQYIPKGWASHEDMVPAEAHGGGRTLGGGAGRGNQADSHHRHVHLQLDLNVHLSARQIGIFAVVAMSLFYGCGLHELAYMSREDSTAMAAATITWAAAALRDGSLGAVPYPVPIPMPKGSRLKVVVSPHPSHRGENGGEARFSRRLPWLAGTYLKGDQVASLIDWNEESSWRTRTQPTRHSKISKGDVGTVLGACDDENKSDRADRVYVDFGEGKGRADFVKSELRLVNRVLVGTYTGDLSEQLTVFLPRRRMSELEISDVVGAILVLGFVSVWTHTAASQDAPFLFVLFSAPFWYTGIYINIMFFLYKII